MRSILTVHNFEYQGCCHWGDIARVGLFPLNFSDPSILQDPWHPCLNLIKGGILSADLVTTVSPTYSQEVKTSEGGRGLHHVLSSLGDKFLGVLNGLDYAFWNPEIDPFLFERFSTSLGMSRILRAKQENKKLLFQQLGLPVCEDKPLVASITRLVPQKGIYLIQNAFFRAESLGMQCVLLGSVADAGTEPLFRALDTELRRKGNGAVLLMSDEMMAHKLYGAADIFVVPSLFEPCGLTQLISLKYGAIPVVRKTGGLADTVIDVDGGASAQQNGFVFDQPDQPGFDSALLRALILYSRNKERWSEYMLRGMKQDFSWHNPGMKYLELYQRLHKI
jgi:starch synthase